MAVHLTETTVWVKCADLQWDCPAAVFVDDGRLRFGRWPSAVPMNRVEPYPIRFVDDEFLVLGSGVFPVAAVLAGLLAHAAGRHPVPGPVELLVLTCPADWGTGRRRVLEAAGLTVAAEVRLLLVPEAVQRGLDMRPAGAGLVLEVGLLGSVAAPTHATDCIRMTDYGSLDIAEISSAAAELVSCLRTRLEDPPSWIAITGELPGTTAQSLIGAVESGWDWAPLVTVVPASAVTAGAYACGLDPERPVPAEVDTAPRAVLPRRRVRATRAVVLAVSAVVLGTAVVGTIGWTGRAPQAAEAPEPERTAQQRVSVGRATVTVPPGWHARDSRRRDRAELVPNAGLESRILLVQNELSSDADLDAVATTLQHRVAQQPGTIRSLERMDVDARQALSYVEVPDADSQVRWRVFVGDQLQVSIGCQTAAERWGDLTDHCDQVIRSLTIIDR